MKGDPRSQVVNIWYTLSDEVMDTYTITIFNRHLGRKGIEEQEPNTDKWD